MSAAPATPPRPRSFVLAVWAAVGLGMLWLVALGGGFYGIYAPELRLVSVAMTAGAIVAWAVAAIRDPSWRPRSAIWPALAVPLAAFAISTVFSQRPRISVEYLGYTVLLVALYLLLRTLLAHAAFRDRVSSLAIPLAAGLGVVYLAVGRGPLDRLVGRRWRVPAPAASPLLRGPHLRQPQRRPHDVGAPDGGGRRPVWASRRRRGGPRWRAWSSSPRP